MPVTSPTTLLRKKLKFLTPQMIDWSEAEVSAPRERELAERFKKVG
jgi:hypothetical protein